MKISFVFLVTAILLCPCLLKAQHQHHQTSATDSLNEVQNVEAQPLLSQVGRLEDALSFLGSSLSKEDLARIKELKDKNPDASTTKAIQEILDPYCLAAVRINPEARVSVTKGPAKAILMQGGWTSFLVKVYNGATITSKLEIKSVNAAPLLHILNDEVLTKDKVANRFLEMSIYRELPMQTNLSGLPLEYAILQIYSKDKGQREAELSFNVGPGTQDIGFRNSTSILFNIKPSVKVKLHVIDDNGKHAMGSFIITDGIERIQENDYRAKTAQNEFGVLAKRLTGIYPLPSRRMAATDEYPDFFFQPQVYRFDGEHIDLSPGNYQVTFTNGPEYLPQTRQLAIPAGVSTVNETFQLKRWINMASLGWYSSDSHIHGAGCSHYDTPEEGVPPGAMFRQALGENLNIANVLSWGPGWYHQKEFFTGADDALSTGKNLMRYDVEVSMFPSSHAGHLVLLNLKEDDYPGTTKIEEWPSWTLPILAWAKAQGGLSGYAHSGWGLEPVTPTNDLPNYVMPQMGGIGANEYIVTVTQDLVDFYSAGDTPVKNELNMWYHTLNCGFRPRLTGETDFPCIYDERVGMGRSYFKPEGALTYASYIDAMKKGRSYVSDGKSHIINFTVNGLEMGTHNSEVSLNAPATVNIKAKVAVYLKPVQDEDGAAINHRLLTERPYWDTERARINNTRKVPVELIVNGIAGDTIEVIADGNWKELNFKHAVNQSSWIALRILASAHTNPIFVIVSKKPIIIRKSAEWCRQAVDQCWKKKQANIRIGERPAAEAAYNKARSIYDKMIQEAEQ